MIRISRGYCLTRPLDATMFEDRRRLFIELMRWNLPVVSGRYEIDQFDGDHAVYIAECDARGRHRGSMRLLPADRPCLLAALFAELVDGTLPHGGDAFEITRLCLPAHYRAAERLAIRNRLITAMVDHALAADIKTLFGLVRPRFREAILAMGWEAAPLGPVRAIGGMSLGAFRIAIDADTPARLARTGIYAAGATLAAAA
ncbi:acyl-homoserine-lactone synthase [Sphingosinicella microcystinivorans]|uniref:Acyl-homoserine-lactone synthase n=1 Tax=Sphingosinicella microcystinivorans TaxID=335406 RepID=A0AAD1D805_SPHMI|nr:acyl-homoserine-lactone synthase [Sphingosinicella microcystinivorans]RKS92232.1 acyl-homoserine lactone synthase [Sphingosinicella microcystinivorans]BBE35254.1 acyl-homoserine-lactone synthase [Sphingosinicella microcystinivorans]